MKTHTIRSRAIDAFAKARGIKGADRLNIVARKARSHKLIVVGTGPNMADRIAWSYAGGQLARAACRVSIRGVPDVRAAA